MGDDVIKWHHYDNLHRSVIGKYPIDVEASIFIASEKLDGSNIGIRVNFQGKVHVSNVQSRNLSIWHPFSPIDLQTLKFAGCTLALTISDLLAAHTLTAQTFIIVPSH
jgi:hypothetical protein